MKTPVAVISAICLCLVSAAGSLAQEAPVVRDVFARINKERTQQRLKPCTYDKTLEKAAQDRRVWELGLNQLLGLPRCRPSAAREGGLRHGLRPLEAAGPSSPGVSAAAPQPAGRRCGRRVGPASAAA